MIHAALATEGGGGLEQKPPAPHRSLRTAFVPLAMLIGIVPLLWPRVPPLLDLLNSMSRYRIALDYATSPYFHRWFDFHWVLVGNLGVDLPVALLGPAIGLEPATKLVVIAIPLLTIAGLALIAREIHGRVPLTAAFAFVFAYNFPLNFGFVNFCLGAAYALLGFGLWLRLARLEQIRLRAALFVPIALFVWLAHACAWGLLGLLCFGAELVMRRTAGLGRAAAVTSAAARCTPLLAALGPMLVWSTSGAFHAGATFNPLPARKLVLLLLSLKNDIGWIDCGSVLLVWSVLTFVIVRADVRFDRQLVCAGLLLLAAFLVLPDKLMGSGYVDLRIAPYALALLALSIRPIARTRFTTGLGLLAIAFFAARMGYQTLSYLRLDRAYTAQLAALDHIPVGTRVFGLARVDCIADWGGNRMDHINRMATVRRQAFTNDTWPPTTASGLVVHPDMVAGYHDLDSQKLIPAGCRAGHDHDMAGALAGIPRDRFDYLWLIDVPAARWPTRDWLRPVWRGADTIVYRIVRRPA